MHVQVTENVAAVIAEWLELLKTILSVTNWRIASTKKVSCKNKDLEMQN